MGTIADKLALIQQTKADIRSAIEAKGQTVADTDPFSAYPDKIRAIEGGGGWDIEPLDAVKVRAALRDTSWPPMPEDVPDHTIVLLLAPVSSVSFSVTCEGQYTVEVKKCSRIDGAWEYEVESSDEFPSAETCAKIYTEETGNNFRLMTISASSISGFSNGWSTATPTVMPGVVELICRLPGMSIPILRGMTDLVWVTELGESGNKLATVSVPFRDCTSLIAIIGPDLYATGISGNTFQDCKNLLAIDMTIKSFRSTGNVFFGCTMLSAIPESCMPRLSSSSGSTFRYCKSLRTINLYSGSAGSVNMQYIFYGCVSLEKITISGGTNITNLAHAFDGCVSLKHLVFNTPSWGGLDFSVKDCAFSRDGLVEMFTGLPAITTKRAITITGNPGVADLTEEDKAIATDKNWTLVL